MTLLELVETEVDIRKTTVVINEQSWNLSHLLDCLKEDLNWDKEAIRKRMSEHIIESHVTQE